MCKTNGKQQRTEMIMKAIVSLMSEKHKEQKQKSGVFSKWKEKAIVCICAVLSFNTQGNL